MALHHRLWTTHTVDNVGRDMTSPPLDNTHNQKRRAWHEITALGLHARSDTVERRRVWHDITALGRAAWSEDIGRGMTSPPLDSTHS